MTNYVRITPDGSDEEILSNAMMLLTSFLNGEDLMLPLDEIKPVDLVYGVVYHFIYLLAMTGNYYGLSPQEVFERYTEMYRKILLGIIDES